jgi:AraC family transcriptional regulator
MQRGIAPDDRRIARVLRYVADNLKTRVSRADAARIASLEPAYFSKHFRRVVGVGFTVWCTKLRIERAKPFLAIVDLPMNQVAEAVGFSDATSLARNFRKHAGFCPRDFRQRVLAGEPVEQHTNRRKKHTKRRDSDSATR